MATLVIDDDMRETITSCLDDLLSPDVFGKLCRLTFPAIFAPCDNCVGNVWTHGGPMPFQQGMCPQCGGAGQRATENTTDIYMSIDFTGTFGVSSNSGWNKVANMGNTVLPNGLIQTRGFATDLMRVRQAETMTIIEPGHPMMNYNFKLNNEPFDQFSIIQARYFIAYWKRIG